MDCNQESQAGFSHNCACHVSKQSVSALGFSSMSPALQTAIGLEILFWLMFPTFSFLIIHQEEVLKNLDCNVGLQASHPYLSIWKHLISILHFQNMLNPNCWQKHWEYGSLGVGNPTTVNNIPNPQTPQTAGLPWRLPLVKSRWLTNSCNLALLGYPSLSYLNISQFQCLSVATAWIRSMYWAGCGRAHVESVSADSYWSKESLKLVLCTILSKTFMS